MKRPILKVFKNCEQPLEIWHKMPKCQTGIKQPFSSAPTASAEKVNTKKEKGVGEAGATEQRLTLLYIT
jgi:hypothetical protein